MSRTSPAVSQCTCRLRIGLLPPASRSSMGRQRTFDPLAAYAEDGYLITSTVICIPEHEQELVMLVSDKSGMKWKLPGGACNWNESVESAALRELHEEAGLQGRIERFMGVFQNAEKGRRTFVFVVTSLLEEYQWDEHNYFGRQRSWFSLDVARKWLLQHYVEQVVYLDRYWLKSAGYRMSGKWKNMSLYLDAFSDTCMN